MTLKVLALVLTIASVSCAKVTGSKSIGETSVAIKDTSRIAHYQLQHVNDTLPSQSIGTVSNGKLINGKLVPYDGPNFSYFDTISYLNHRAYLNDKVLQMVLETYASFYKSNPKQQFTIMECSGQTGGHLHPHRTHQNGLSIDFMMPLVQNGKPCYDYDNTGQQHYLLDFNDVGQLTQDTSVSIDFELVAQHILVLDSIGKQYETEIKKVIINTDLKPELFKGSFGQRLQSSGIYIVQSLKPLINSLHDDHYHIDFGIQ